MILEYYLVRKYRADSADIIKQLVKRHKCKQWLVNTQDFFAFPIMLDLQLQYDIDAYKFAIDDAIRIDYELGSEMTIEVTTIDEIKDVYQLIMQDAFYSGGNINSLSPFIAAHEVYSLRKNNKLIGVGFVGQSKRTPSYADIAMIIDRENRCQGYGVLLVQALVDKCRLLKLIPTAVCDVKNLTSRKVLQKVGFNLDGCLLIAQVDKTGLQTAL
jgi:predicted acetyltransferase